MTMVKYHIRALSYRSRDCLSSSRPTVVFCCCITDKRIVSEQSQHNDAIIDNLQTVFNLYGECAYGDLLVVVGVHECT